MRPQTARCSTWPSPALPSELRQGDLGSLRALLAVRTRGPALTAELDARRIGANQYTLLAWAACYGQADAVRLLLESGASAGATTGDGSTALFVACYEGQVECAHLLLEASAAISQAANDGATPLFVVCYKGRLECGRQLDAAAHRVP